MNHFTVEQRKTCRVCGTPITEKRFRCFCSKECRTKETNKRHYKSQIEWARRNRGKYEEGKLQCRICEQWYVQVCSHTMQRHKLSGREYRELMDLPLKRGVVPHWYRELKGNQAIDNKTSQNLLSGKPFRYTKDDPRAKPITGWKGRKGSLGYTPDEFYQ